MVTLTLEDKIKLAEDEIKKHYQLNDGNIFVSFSGGKDSTVLRHIALKLYPDLKVVFSDTTNELHEVYQFVKSFNNVVWCRPTISFIDSVKLHGFPLVSKEVSHLVWQLKNIQSSKTKKLRMYGNNNGVGKVPEKWKFLAEQRFDLNNKCCQRLKKDPLEKFSKETGLKPMIAIMSGESRLRKQLAMYGKDDGNHCYPFLRTGWTDQDIWEYADKFNIRFAECYYDRYVGDIFLKGENRTGCEYCGFGIHLEENSRFNRSRLLTPKRYKKMMGLENNGVKFSEAIDIVMKKELPVPVLGLYGYEIVKFEEEEHDIHIELKHLHDKKKCKHCNSSSMRKKGKRNQFYFDTPMRGKRVGLHIEVQGYLCNDCNKFSQAYLPFMSETHSMTDRLVEYIKNNSLQRPFTHLANEIGVSEGIIRKMFKSHVASLSEIYKFETPKVMGIDEIHLSGRARAVITNIEEKTIIEMFKDRNKTTIIKYLESLENPYVVLNVAIDMWKPYKDSVNQVLPDAVVVIDKFHVIKMANEALERCRKDIKRSLTHKQRLDLKNDRFLLLKRKHALIDKESFMVSYWENNYPNLAKMYYLKEQFFEIYDAKTKEDAYDRYAKFEAKLTQDVKPYWTALVRAVGNWHNEIFAYFDYPVTNAYTEAMNSVIRHVDRMGRSYSFETIRAKMLYSKSIHKTQKPKIDKRRSMKRDTVVEMGKVGYGLPTFARKVEVKNYGADILELAKLLEKGVL